MQYWESNIFRNRLCTILLAEMILFRGRGINKIINTAMCTGNKGRGEHSLERTLGRCNANRRPNDDRRHTLHVVVQLDLFVASPILFRPL